MVEATEATAVLQRRISTGIMVRVKFRRTPKKSPHADMHAEATAR